MVPESTAPAQPLSKKKATAIFLLEILAYFVLSRDGILPSSPQMSPKQDKHHVVFWAQVGPSAGSRRQFFLPATWRPSVTLPSHLIHKGLQVFATVKS